MTLPKWVERDLRKTGPEFFNSRLAQQAFRRAVVYLALSTAICYHSMLQDIGETLIEVHGKKEGLRQFAIVCETLKEQGAKKK